MSLSKFFIDKDAPPDLGPISTRYQWCCNLGCGECKPLLVEFRTFVRTSDGEVEAQETEPRMVSDCCGEGMFLWDTATDKDGPAGYSGQLAKED